MARRDPAPPPSTCPVCSAPSLPAGGLCPFCHSPLVEPRDESTLLDYLAARLPAVRASRSGLLRRGPVKSLQLATGDRRFGARRRRRGLELTPDLPLEQWVPAVLHALSVAAASDHELRAAMARAGWSLR